jgi:hypothetical protein
MAPGAIGTIGTSNVVRGVKSLRAVDSVGYNL